MITFHVYFVSFLFLFSWGGGVLECRICLIVLVVNLLTGFKALVPPLKSFTLGVSAVILDGASIVQILKCVGVSTVQ